MSGLEMRLVELLRQGPLTAQEIMLETQWADGTTYCVLAGLRRSGIVEIAQVKLRGFGNGSGRGRAVYRLAS